jgi:hypothetical protein
MAPSSKAQNEVEKPAYVAAMEKAYGPPGDAGFGSAVFFQVMTDKADLEDAAKKVYQHYVGKKWQERGAETWMGPWREAYRRQDGTKHAIVQELKGIKDPDVSQSIPMILEVVEGAADARKALVAAYDPPEAADVRVYNIGDGEAMSGFVLAGRRENGESTFLVFLMD